MINGYCRDRVGSRFIERGDYQMVLSEDGTTMETSVFATTVEPGMVLEMSIVVSLADEIPKQCPKCQCTDPGIADGAWIEWKVYLYSRTLLLINTPTTVVDAQHISSFLLLLQSEPHTSQRM